MSQYSCTLCACVPAASGAQVKREDGLTVHARVWLAPHCQTAEVVAEGGSSVLKFKVTEEPLLCNGVAVLVRQSLSVSVAV